MPFSAVIFDLDGVLVDSIDHYVRAEKLAFADYGVKLEPADSLELVGMSEKESCALLAKKFKLDISGELLSRRVEYHLFFLLGEKPLLPMPHAVEFLEALRQRDIPLAVASSSSRPVVEAFLTATGLRTYFKTVVSASDVVRAKPDPSLYISAAQALNVKPDSCLVVEDALHGVTAAKAAGMYCVGLHAKGTDASHLKGADRIVTDLSQVAQYLLPILDK